MSKKNTIRLTENELKQIITESVKRILKESNERYIPIDMYWWDDIVYPISDDLTKYMGITNDEEYEKFLDELLDVLPDDEVTVNCLANLIPGQEQTWWEPAYPSEIEYWDEYYLEDEKKISDALKQKYGEEFTKFFFDLIDKYFKSQHKYFLEKITDLEYLWDDDEPDWDPYDY